MATNNELRISNGTNYDTKVLIATAWSLVDGKPSTYTPTAHNHDASNINAGTLGVDRIPSLSISKITSLQDSLNNIIYPSGDWHHFTDPNPFEVGFIDNSWINRLDFFPRENVLVETSSDGVSFSTTTEYSDTVIKQLLGGDTSASLTIPNLGTIGSGYKRLTFTPYTYVSLSCLYIWSTKVTGTLQVKVEKFNNTTSSWEIIEDYTNIAGWPSHHTLRHSTIWWASSQTYTQVRLTFYGATTDVAYPNHQIRIIQWWGGYPSGNRKPFYFDENKVVSFPSDVKANGTVLVKTNDSRLSDSRPASDVSSWAKESKKPSYNQDEVSDGSTYKRVTQSEKDTWNAKSTLALGETSSTAYRGDRGKTAYDHSQVAHAPSNAQKNSDITKAEIEAKLTGLVTTHEHAFIREGASQNQILFESGIAKFYSEGIGVSYDLYHKGNLAAGTGATNFCAGNDARLSDARTPSSHVHGNISNDGKIGSTAGLIIKTGASGVLTTLAAGTTSQYLRGDGIWDTPAGSGGLTKTLLGSSNTATANSQSLTGMISNVPGGSILLVEGVSADGAYTLHSGIFVFPTNTSGYGGHFVSEKTATNDIELSYDFYSANSNDVYISGTSEANCWKINVYKLS